MTTTDILKTITHYLPADSPYFRATPKRTFFDPEPLPLSARLAKGLRDIKFPWNVAASYAETGETLPPTIGGDIRRAYYFISQNYHDPEFHLVQALALLDPAYAHQRQTLEALLICRDIDLPGIAGWMGQPLEVVDYFQRLFFNVRDRIDDHSFIASIVLPEMRYPTFQSDYQDITSTRQKLLQLGHRCGAVEVVYVAGLSRKRLDKRSMKSRTEELREALVENALDLVRSGFANTNAPGMKHAMTLVLAEQHHPDTGFPDESVKGLGAITIGDGIMETLQGLQAKGIQTRIGLAEESPTKQ